MRNSEFNQNGLKIAIGFILSCTFFAAVSIFLLGGRPNEIAAKMFVVAMLGIFYGLVGAIGFSGFRNTKTRQLSIVTIAITMVGYFLFLIQLFLEIPSPTLIIFVVCLLVAAVALAQIVLLYKINIINRYAQTTRIVAVVAISLFTLLLLFTLTQVSGFDYYSLVNGGFMNEGLGKFLYAVLLIDIGFTAATPLTNKLTNGLIETEEDYGEFLKEWKEKEAEERQTETNGNKNIFDSM